MKANQGSVVEEAQKQLEVTRIAFIRLILNLQEENEAYDQTKGLLWRRLRNNWR